MRSFSDSNPIVLLIYFIATAGTAMFLMNPVILAISLLGAVLLFYRAVHVGRSPVFMIILWLVIALLNPLFYHNGRTVLLVVNNNPITLEALIYGMVSATMVVAVLYWCRSFSNIMTSDRVLYLFGRFAPRIALGVSMAIRYVPLFGAQTRKVNRAQKAMGLYADDNPVNAFRGGVRVASVMTTWALENGITTADSMDARGYGCRKRTNYSLFRFRKQDMLLLTLILAAFTVTIFCAGDTAMTYYPDTSRIPESKSALTAYISYAVLALLPFGYGIAEDLRWKYLQSKI